MAQKRRAMAKGAGSGVLFWAFLCFAVIGSIASALVVWPQEGLTMQAALRLVTIVSGVACIVLFVSWEHTRKR